MSAAGRSPARSGRRADRRSAHSSASTSSIPIAVTGSESRLEARLELPSEWISDRPRAAAPSSAGAGAQARFGLASELTHAESEPPAVARRRQLVRPPGGQAGDRREARVRTEQCVAEAATPTQVIGTETALARAQARQRTGRTRAQPRRGAHPTPRESPRTNANASTDRRRAQRVRRPEVRRTRGSPPAPSSGTRRRAREKMGTAQRARGRRLHVRRLERQRDRPTLPSSSGSGSIAASASTERLGEHVVPDARVERASGFPESHAASFSLLV